MWPENQATGFVRDTNASGALAGDDAHPCRHMQSYCSWLFDRERYFLQTLIGFIRPFQLQRALNLPSPWGFPSADLANSAVPPAAVPELGLPYLHFSPPLYSDQLLRASSSRLASGAAIQIVMCWNEKELG